MIAHNYPQIGPEELAAVESVLLGRHLAQGAEVEHFEAEFARVIGADHAVAVTNGTVAIELALLSLGIGPGDEVIVPSFTFVATANAVRRSGAEVIFADIDPKTYCISATTISSHLTEKTRAVIVVHLYGHPAEMDDLVALCDAKGVALIEDSAQGIGTKWRGQHVGTFGAAATFSLYATKNITTGEGGIVATSDLRVAEAVRALRAHKGTEVNGHLRTGTNARMTDIAAAIGRAQLKKLDEMQIRRRHLAAIYDRELSASLTTPFEAPEATHGFHQYTIRPNNRDRLVSALEQAEIGYGIYYETPCHLLPEYRNTRSRLPETESAARHVVSIPIRPDLTESEQARVIETVNKGESE